MTTRRVFHRSLIFVSLLVSLLVPVTSTSLRAQGPMPQRIESDADAVQRMGDWSSQPASQASAGGYLYNASGEAALSLNFSGPSLEVIYVSGPSLGTLAIEVDGTVLRTVITTAESTAYGQSAKIDYLTDEAHELKVYAQGGGVVAVDAFISVPPQDTHLNEPISIADAVAPRYPCGQSLRAERLSINPLTGLQSKNNSIGQDITPDGRFVVFVSAAKAVLPGHIGPMMDDILVYDRLACTLSLVAPAYPPSTVSDVQGGAIEATISDDGRHVAFQSVIETLVPNDTNGRMDVFVRDMQTNTTTRVSVDSAGTQAINEASQPAISGDGRYVAFQSVAGNLVPSDTNNSMDVFVHDRQTSTTTRVSLADNGAEGTNGGYGASISADGRYVAFGSFSDNLVANDTNGQLDIFVRDRQLNTTTRVSVASDGSQANNRPRRFEISGDGQRVVFDSSATNLVVGDTNNWIDIFVHDILTATTALVSTASDGTQGGSASFDPFISNDGRYVLFTTQARNLGPTPFAQQFYRLYIKDLQTGQTTLASVAPSGNPADYIATSAAISEGGRYVVYQTHATNMGAPPDTNVRYDVYIGDQAALFVHSDLQASAPLPPTQINLAWTQNAPDPTLIQIQRSADGIGGWAPVGAVGVGQTNFSDTALTCDTPYYYRLFAATNTSLLYQSISAVVGVRTRLCAPDTLAFYVPGTGNLSLLNTLQDNPPPSAYNTFTVTPPAGGGGDWVMGDWDGNGTKTPAVYAPNGAFFYTNTIGTGATWTGIWIGLAGRVPVAGRFDESRPNDCLGAIDSLAFPPHGTAFALYFKCDLTSGPNPPISFQWLSVPLQDQFGFSGQQQFATGDFDNDGLDSIAVRRTEVIAYTNVPPTSLLATYDRALYIGNPESGDYGQLVVGDWDQNHVSSFGLVYANGHFYRRDDLDWNSQQYILQHVGQPLGTPFNVISWR